MIDLLGLGQLAEHVGQPLVVHRLGDLVPALDRQLLQRVRDVGGVELAVGGDAASRRPARPAAGRGPRPRPRPSWCSWPRRPSRPGSWTASRESTQSPVRVCSIAGVDDVRRPAGLDDAHRPVEQLAEHQRLAGPLLEALEVQRAGGQHHRAGVDRGHPAHRHEDPAAGDDLDDQAQHARRGGADPQRDDDVADLADPVAVGVEDGQAGEPGDVRPGHRRHECRGYRRRRARPGNAWTTRSSTCSRRGRSRAIRWPWCSTPTT